MNSRPNRLWTKDEQIYFEENWGYKSAKTIAGKLNRSETAIIARSEKQGLGGAYASGEDLSANQVAKILDIDSHTIVKRWIGKYGLKGKMVVLRTKRIWRINLTDLIEWLELNQSKWDSSRLELLSLGSEPNWLKAKRKSDIKKPVHRVRKWTKKEEGLLISFINHGLTQKEIGERLGRTEIGIRRKVSKLVENGVLKKKKIIVKWTSKEGVMLRNLESQGLSDEEIALNLGRDRWNVVDYRRRMREKGIYKGRKPRNKVGVSS